MPRIYISDYTQVVMDVDENGQNQVMAFKSRAWDIQEGLDNSRLVMVDLRDFPEVGGTNLAITNNTNAEHAAVSAHANITFMESRDIDLPLAGNYQTLLEANNLPWRPGLTVRDLVHYAHGKMRLRFVMQHINPNIDDQLDTVPANMLDVVLVRLANHGFDTSSIAPGNVWTPGITFRDVINDLVDQPANNQLRQNVNQEISVKLGL